MEGMVRILQDLGQEAELANPMVLLMAKKEEERLVFFLSLSTMREAAEKMGIRPCHIESLILMEDNVAKELLHDFVSQTA